MSAMALSMRFLDPTKRELKPSASIHASGKLGFNMDAASFMMLDKLPSYIVAVPNFERIPLRFFLIDSAIAEKNGSSTSNTRIKGRKVLLH